MILTNFKNREKKSAYKRKNIPLQESAKTFITIKGKYHLKENPSNNILKQVPTITYRSRTGRQLHFCGGLKISQ